MGPGGTPNCRLLVLLENRTQIDGDSGKKAFELLRDSRYEAAKTQFTSFRAQTGTTL